MKAITFDANWSSMWVDEGRWTLYHRSRVLSQHVSFNFLFCFENLTVHIKLQTYLYDKWASKKSIKVYLKLYLLFDFADMEL